MRALLSALLAMALQAQPPAFLAQLKRDEDSVSVREFAALFLRKG